MASVMPMPALLMRSGTTRSSENSGTGLGLSIVQRLVSSFGGVVSV
jgi:signal transduction histidine kinase